jgi:signal transduction histidine kinase
VVVLALSVLFGLLLADYFARPLEALRQAARRVSEGDLSVRLERLRGGVEVTGLGEAFDGMVAKLRALVVKRDDLDSALTNFGEGLVLFDAEGVARYLNRTAAELLEADPGNPPRLNELSSDPTLVPSPGSTALDTSLVVREHGERGSLLLRVSVTPLEPGQGYACLLRDVTAEEATQAEVERQRRELQQSRQLAAIGALGAMITHRLNQPLSSIRLFLQQALRELRNERGREETIEKLTDSLEEVERASSSLKEILSAARPPTGERSDEVRFDDVAKRMITSLTEQIHRSGLAVRTEGLDALPPFVGARKDWEEAFFILVENACHACRPPGARLVIRGEAGPTATVLTFADSCGGIRAEILPKIFDLFFSTKARGSGTGLGLYILKQIVESYEGVITVQSTVGLGTTFRIELPLVERRIA